MGGSLILNLSLLLPSNQVFWKSGTFLKKLEHPFFVESARIKSATYPYKAALSKTNAKTNNRKGSAKWTYHKEQSFTINYFILFESLV